MTTKAPDILTAALGHMQDRAATYDKPEGERSMPATVAAFNALTGHNLTAEQGWLFMTVLKLCRTQQGGHRPDNYEDGAAYFALMGEQAACDRGAPAEEEWIKHDGSDKCPVPKGTLIDVQYTDGDRAYGIRALMEDDVLSERGESCGAQYWGSVGGNNITHYRFA